MFTLADGKDITWCRYRHHKRCEDLASGNTTKSDITGTDQADIIVGSVALTLLLVNWVLTQLTLARRIRTTRFCLRQRYWTPLPTSTGASKDEVQFDVSTINAGLRASLPVGSGVVRDR